jgi:autotransporter translocation and assembly factor TamB
VALDVQAGGTITKPAFSGSAAIHLKEARMDAPNIPAIGHFDADLAFAEDTLNFRTFKGEVGGGTFNLGGKVRLGEGIITGKMDGVAFDLALKADKVLAMRNDSITLRADADVKLAGPLNSASATGTVWVTQSRFFKEIDILPIGLPGRPKPAPKSAPGDLNVSFPNPPLADWKFDITIKTRENDPFLVRGNLANGAVSLSLQFGGTGLAPWLDGQVRIDDFKASLPFSTLTITRGFVYFKKDEPFRASVDLQAESKIREYTIGALIHGAATDPQVEFTSEPPLPHADIVSLLATGTTTSELAGSADVLASRAAMLAVQSLYRKVFTRGASKAQPQEKKDDNFMDRFQLELGAVDNRTGARDITTRFKFDEHTYFVGDIDTQGRYTGSLKYLLRFR